MPATIPVQSTNPTPPSGKSWTVSQPANFPAVIAISSDPLLDELLNNDAYLLFADYQSYVDCQDQVSATFLDQEKWSKMSIYNAVRMGRFSSDRAIEEYCRNIWEVNGL